MTELDTLGKIDLLRERVDVSYEQARAALEEHGGDVVDALVALERGGMGRREMFFARGSELVERLGELLRKGNVTKIRVRRGDHDLLELPVTAGVVGAVVAPDLAMLGAIAALATGCTVEIERAPRAQAAGVH
ncbi:MAG: DUF4342 domain-containing protein [Bacteroidota bacterium]